MNKTIVTTTINPPTEATKKFCLKDDWNFLIIGDLKTPHEEYWELEKEFPNVKYLNPTEQEEKYPKLSNAIGWKCIQRRNIGFVEAYNQGADLIATVDDDNIPYDNWGKDVCVGKEIEYDSFSPKEDVFDPLSITKTNHLWHRGYPIQLLKNRKNVKKEGKKKRKALVQANLWDGDPDIDAMARLTFRPEVNYDEITGFYGSDKISPFNSQNTFLDRSVLPHYAVFPHVGRMDDIWGAYVLQHFFPQSVVYGPATVYQDRNEQDLIKNLEMEVLGYRNTLDLVRNIERFEDFLPDETKRFWEVYQKSFSD